MAVPAVPPAAQVPSVPEKVVKWFIFSVMLALVPIGFAIFSRATRDPAGVDLDRSAGEVLAKGQLYLVAVALCAAALGELFISQNQYRIARLLVSGGLILILLSSALLFADVAAAQLDGTTIDFVLVRTASAAVFIAAVVTSAASTVLSALK